MNESTLVPREEMSDLDWLARNVHVWPLITPKVISAGDELFEFGANFYDNCVDIYGKFAGCGLTVTKDQWLARRAELQNKPRWEDAPGWATHLGQNKRGQWYFMQDGQVVDNAHIYHMHKKCSGEICVGEVLGDWRDTLEKRPADLSEQAVTARLQEATNNVLAAAPELMKDRFKFEPLVSVEDAATAKRPAITPSKYTKTIHGVSVDVYDVLQAWGVSNPALQHLIKKALQCGQRGHKDNAQDLQDIIDSAIRAKELEC